MNMVRVLKIFQRKKKERAQEIKRDGYTSIVHDTKLNPTLV